jgi:coenzyme PQQ precursor peptide PqqA
MSLERTRPSPLRYSASACGPWAAWPQTARDPVGGHDLLVDGLAHLAHLLRDQPHEEQQRQRTDDQVDLQPQGHGHAPFWPHGSGGAGACRARFMKIMRRDSWRRGWSVPPRAATISCGQTVRFQGDSMIWQTPQAQDFRFGFEITMYVAAR